MSIPYVSRNKDLAYIHRIISQRNTLILTGKPGIGKTSLLKEYEVKFRHLYARVANYHAYEIKKISLQLDIWKKDNAPNNNLLIIDGFNEFPDNEVKNELSLLLLLSQKKGHKMIIAGRDSKDLMRLTLRSEHFVLEGLSKSEVDQLVDQIVTANNLSLDDASKLRESTYHFEGTPLPIQDFFHLLKYTSISDVEKYLAGEINYENQLITQPELVTDIRIINTFLWTKINDDPQLLRKITPRQFEEVVAELFVKKGYDVELTQQSRDGGKDLYLIKHTEFGKMLYLVECKQRRGDIPVGVGIIRSLYGSVIQEKATAGILVTTSYFSKPAYDFQSTVQYQMNLIDFHTLSKMINQIS